MLYQIDGCGSFLPRMTESSREAVSRFFDSRENPRLFQRPDKWKRELGAADRKQSPAFVEVVAPVSTHAETELSRDGAESGVQLVYGATMRIHLRCGFDAATLRRAIEALAH
jgi:hypothetical protein